MPSVHRVIIIYGAFGYPGENWFPWLKSVLVEQDVEVDIPIFPTPENHNLSNWLSAFEEQIGPLKPTDIVVAHSLGPAFLFCLLERSDVKIHASFLIGAFLGHVEIKKFDQINTSFFEDSFNWHKIRQNAGKIHIFHGDNDPYVTLDNINNIAKNLNAEINWIKGAGHINFAAGYSEFPEIIPSLQLVLVDVHFKLGAVLDNQNRVHGTDEKEPLKPT